MANNEFQCVKCGGPMRLGFVSDNEGSTFYESYWIEGEPVRKKLFGISGINLDIDGQRKFKIKALRCEKCGYLESYAV
jgi:predicted nucleic-acid-binding Zn-ribbon protein